MNLEDVASIKTAFFEYAAHEAVAKEHSARIAELAEEIGREREQAEADFAQAEAALDAALAVKPVGGAVPARKGNGYEQGIFFLPGDYVYVIQRDPEGDWDEHLYGPPLGEIEDSVEALKQRNPGIPRDATFDHLEPELQERVREHAQQFAGVRVAEDGKQLRGFPRVNVAVREEGSLPTLA